MIVATLYDFQHRVDQVIRSGRNVILQAPTGAGKTRAALFPFLDAWRDNDPARFPRQCVYVVPLRTLANQFECEYREIVQRFTTSHGLREKVSIQTGARPVDPKFEADLIFTTLDQMLSSALTIPYSLSNRQANLNAGAIVGSYLVFDEFHLFPVDEHGDGAMATTLHLLKLLKGITPFVLMTATFSGAMLHQLARELDAEAITLTPDEIAAIPSQQGKQRRYRYTAQPLNAAALVADIQQHQRQRVVAVCNTVDRAEQLAADLQADPVLADVEVMLLHSRFYASDRATKEDQIACEFGPDASQRTAKPVILVATQVIEVGLNITCDVLHTELAPANALVQRAGRCARFAGERGDVLVYDVPLRDDGTPNYAPYINAPRRDADEEGQSAICERTRIALADLPPDGAVLSYHEELALVDRAHEPFDQRLLARLHNNQTNLAAEIQRVMRDQDRTATRDLIRDVDSRTVLIHHHPTRETLPDPLRYEGISLRKGTLLKWFTDVQNAALERELDWIAQVGVFVEDRDGSTNSEDAEQQRRRQITWQALRPTTDKADLRAGREALATCSIVALNPTLVRYDPVLGFRLDNPDGTPTNNSPRDESPKAQREHYGPIKLETYAQHIEGLLRVYLESRDGHASLKDQTAAAQRRFEERHKLQPGALDRAIRLMFAVHDLGKLDQKWQAWAHAWQRVVSGLYPEFQSIGLAYMAAHTDFDSRDPKQRDASKRVRPQRPPHAAESARAGRDLLRAIAGSCDDLYVALMSAIVCHHSARLDRIGHGPFCPAGAAAHNAFNEAMRAVNLLHDPTLRASGKRVDWQGFGSAEALSDAMIRVDRPAQVVLYLLLVRVLRLADQASQEHII
jgi:CRISPR-associated endonuclease/helicase Cas3